MIDNVTKSKIKLHEKGEPKKKTAKICTKPFHNRLEMFFAQFQTQKQLIEKRVNFLISTILISIIFFAQLPLKNSHCENGNRSDVIYLCKFVD